MTEGLNDTPEQANTRIHFSGEAGANLEELTKCPTGTTCWLNFGGGGDDTSVDVHHYYHCSSSESDADCALGKGTQTDKLNQVIQQMKDKDYTGVTFDYEVDDTSVPSLSEWKGLNQIFQDKGWTTALTMADAGLGTDLKYGLHTDDGKETFLGYQVPFTYNIPQLYGGKPMIYTGEYNPDWDTQKPRLTGYGVGGKKPLKTLCENMNDNTMLIPSFGGQPPVNGLSGVSKLCPDPNQYNGKSFISWNINDPNTSTGCGATHCQITGGDCVQRSACCNPHPETPIKGCGDPIPDSGDCPKGLEAWIDASEDCCSNSETDPQTSYYICKKNTCEPSPFPGVGVSLDKCKLGCGP